MRARETLLAGAAGACLMLLWYRVDDAPSQSHSVVAPSSRVTSSPRAAAMTSTVNARAAPADDAAPGEVHERERAEPFDAAAHLVELATAFDAERADSPWSRTAQVDLQARATKALPSGSLIASLECRASLCRIESVHVGLNELDAFIDKAFLRPVPGESGYGLTFAEPQVGADHRIRSVGFMQPPAVPQ